MALQTTEIGALVSVYVGSSGQSTPLTQIFSQRTGGGVLKFKTPEVFLDSANNSVQSGRAVLSFNSVHLVDSIIGTIDQLVALAMGNPITTSPGDAPSAFTTLSVFLQHKDGYNGNFSIWIPLCYAAKTLDENWNKDKASVIPLAFTMSGRNIYSFDGTHQPFYQRTNAALAALMNSQYPLAY